MQNKPLFNNLILIGFMGTGKTTVGKILAEKLELNFFDLDQEIEKDSNLKINEIFEKFGESCFRKLERNYLETFVSIKDTIICTGGGTFCNQENIDILKNSGRVIYLKTSFENLIKRYTNKEIKKRPLLKDLEKAKQLLISREKYYLQADFTLNTDNKDVKEIAMEIISTLKIL